MPEGWITQVSELTLCLSGYPIRIRLRIGRTEPYALEVDGQPTRSYSSLALARHEALCSAAEWDALIESALADDAA